MKSGRVVEGGRHKLVMDHPKQDYTQRLVRATLEAEA
jgi:ABC-type microcin C transport system duplicated ATPase subunit YejF